MGGKEKKLIMKYLCTSFSQLFSSDSLSFNITTALLTLYFKSKFEFKESQMKGKAWCG
jgi:hypothetical protein